MARRTAIPSDIRQLIDEGRWADLWLGSGDIALTNHGSFGRPFAAVRAAHAALEQEFDADPARFYRHDHHRRVEAAADMIGEWLGVPDTMATAFTHNASTAVLDAVTHFARPGGPILGTNLGYGGIAYGLRGLATRLGTTFEEIELSSIDEATELGRLVAGEVGRLGASVVVLDQISSATALRLPIKDIIAEIRSASPRTRIVVDAAHAAGMEPTPIVADADAWVTNLHKWVCAATGAAVIVAPRGSDMAPALRSWTGDEPFPHSFTWQGTDSKAAYLTAPLATAILDALLTAGLDAHITNLVGAAGDMLAEVWGVAPEPRPPAMAARWMRLVGVPLPRPLAQDELNDACLTVRNRLGADIILTQFQGSTYLRLSAHAYNTPSDYDRLVDIPKVLATTT
ncbi:MAG: aminotransferase class V-fold PLP-dependent enzyme [Acidimicrobiia bacterium]